MLPWCLMENAQRHSAGIMLRIAHDQRSSRARAFVHAEEKNIEFTVRLFYHASRWRRRVLPSSFTAHAATRLITAYRIERIGFLLPAHAMNNARSPSSTPAAHTARQRTRRYKSCRRLQVAPKEAEAEAYCHHVQAAPARDAMQPAADATPAQRRGTHVDEGEAVCRRVMGNAEDARV